MDWIFHFSLWFCVVMDINLFSAVWCYIFPGKQLLFWYKIYRSDRRWAVADKNCTWKCYPPFILWFYFIFLFEYHCLIWDNKSKLKKNILVFLIRLYCKNSFYVNGVFAALVGWSNAVGACTPNVGGDHGWCELGVSLYGIWEVGDMCILKRGRGWGQNVQVGCCKGKP